MYYLTGALERNILWCAKPEIALCQPISVILYEKLENTHCVDLSYICSRNNCMETGRITILIPILEISIYILKKTLARK